MPPTTEVQRPQVTPEGQAAASRIAAARATRNAAPVTPATPTRATTTIRASDIGNAPAQTTPPQPTPATIPTRVGQMVGNVTRDTQGFIVNQSAEAAKARELADTFGALNNEGSLADMMRAERSNLGIDTNLKELQDIQLQLTDIDTGSGLTKSRLEGGAGQTAGQLGRELTQEDRENAVRTSGLAARAAVLQGNINTATQLARDTVDLAFKDRQLKAENLLNQLNYFQGISDQQTGQLLEQDKRQYEAELANIKELKDNIANAMVNGASQAEITQLNDANLDDASKLALAQSITARGANQMRNLDMEQSRASINASNASARNSDVNAAKAEFELDLLKNPPLTTGVDPATIKIINDLDSGTREGIINARSTTQELTEMKAIISRNSDINLLTNATEDGRRFDQLKTNVVDKLARERTGAVVGADEEKQFSRILGVGVFNRISKSDTEILTGLDRMINIHSETLRLSDPTGEIVDFLDAGSLTGEDDAETNTLWGIPSATQTPFNPASNFR